MKEKIIHIFNEYILKSNRYLILFFILSLYMFLRYKNLPFFNDELIVNSKGFFSIPDLLYYSAFSSYHPPLTFFIHKFINNFEIFHERYYRFAALAIYFFSISFSWSINRDTKFRLGLLLLTLTNYYYYFSLIVTNYFLGISTLILFLAHFLKQRSENTNYIQHHIIALAVLSFFSSYTAGIACLLILFVDGLIYYRKRTLDILFFQIVCFLSTYAINFFPSYDNEAVMAVSYVIILLNLIFYRPIQLLKDTWILQIVFTWMTYRFLNYMNVQEVHNLAYKPNPYDEIKLLEFLPLYLSIALLLVFFIYRKIKIKENFSKSFITISLTALILTLPFVVLAIGGKQIYARYFLYSIPLIYLSTAYLLHDLKIHTLKIIAVGLVFTLSIFTKRYDVTYLGIQKTRSIYDKITSHGKYGKFVLYFSDSYSWHKFYLKDYRIEDNFKLFMFMKTCNEETFDKTLKMAGENAFFVNYYRDCPQMKQYILNNCEKYDSKCFDLGAEDGDVILKIFEPWSQEAKIQELEAKYPIK